MTSFRLKLVVYFLLLSLLPLAAAFSGFAAVARKSQTRLVDVRLQAELGAALAAYKERLSVADASARSLARDPSFQRAIAERDLQAVKRAATSYGDIVVEGPGGFRIGSEPKLAAQRRAEIVRRGRLIGAVVAWVPLGPGFLEELRRRSGLRSSDAIVLLERGQIVAGPRGLHGRLAAPPGAAHTVSVGDVRYRVLVAAVRRESPVRRFAVLGLQSKIDAASSAIGRRLVLALAALLGLVAAVAYFEGRTVTRTVSELSAAARAFARGRLNARVRVRGRDELAVLGRTFNDMASELAQRLEELDAERARLSAAFLRFGEVLQSTLNHDELARVIVESAVAVTRAEGGMLTRPTGKPLRVGSMAPTHRTIEVPVKADATDFGTLRLFGRAFDEEALANVASLVSAAAIALENQRLHVTVERQAHFDELTDLPNRRYCATVLEAEVRQAERLGLPVTVGLVDLDGFKAVNDTHGHATGDDLLREVARVLRDAAGEDQLVGRWGGEEFILVLPGTTRKASTEVAEAIRKALRGSAITAPTGELITVTASFGLATYPDHPTVDDLLSDADDALYRAKAAGKDRVVTAEAAGKDRVAHRLRPRSSPQPVSPLTQRESADEAARGLPRLDARDGDDREPLDAPASLLTQGSAYTGTLEKSSPDVWLTAPESGQVPTLPEYGVVLAVILIGAVAIFVALAGGVEEAIHNLARLLP